MFILSSIVKLAKCRRSCGPVQGRNREAKKENGVYPAFEYHPWHILSWVFLRSDAWFNRSFMSKITQVSAKVGKSLFRLLLVSGFKRKEVSSCL